MKFTFIYIVCFLFFGVFGGWAQGIPDVQITGGTSSPIINETSTYTISISSGSIGSITATPGAGVSILSINQSGTVTVKYTGYGSTYFQVDVVDTNSGQHYGSKYVTVRPPSPTANDQSRCGTGTVTLTASGVSGATYKWYTNSGTYQHTGASFTTPSISNSTTYKVEAVVSNTPSAQVSVEAIVIPFDISNLYFSGGGSYCTIDGQSGRKLELYDINGEAGYEDLNFYLYRSGTSGWLSHKTIEANQNTSGTPLSIVFNPSAYNVKGDAAYEYSAGSYTVKVTRSGCSNQWMPNTEVITQAAESGIEISPNDEGDGPFNYTVCPGSSVQIKTGHADSELYVAATGNTKVSGYSKSGGVITGQIAPGTYYAGRSSSAACVDNSRVAITIAEHTAPLAPTLVEASQTVCVAYGTQTNVTFTVNEVSGFTYHWYDQATNGTLLATGPSYTALSLGVNESPYTIYVRGYKECTNLESTSATATVNLIEMPDLTDFRLSDGGTFCSTTGGSSMYVTDISGSGGYASDVEFHLYKETGTGDQLLSTKTMDANENSLPNEPLVIVFDDGQPEIPGDSNYKYGAGAYKVKLSRNGCQEFSYPETSIIAITPLSTTSVVGESPNGAGQIEYVICPGETFEIKTNQETAEIYTTSSGTEKANGYYMDAVYTSTIQATIPEGTYFVGASGNCVDNGRVEIVVKEYIAPLPPTVLSGNNQTKCVASGATTSLSFAVDQEAGMSYVWYDQETAGTALATGATFDASNLAASTDPYSFYVRSYKDCDSKESTAVKVEGTINEIPELVLSDQKLFTDNVLDLNYLAGTNVVSWTGEGVTSNEFQAYYVGPGNYVLNYDYQQGACETIGSINVEVLDKPTLKLTGFTEVKSNQDVVLSIDNYSSDYSYTWLRDGVDITHLVTNNQLSTDTPGVYQLQIELIPHSTLSNRIVLTGVKTQQDLNFIETARYKTEQLSQATLPTDKESVMINFSYFDGLGRQVQSVAKNITSSGEDLVAIADYDAYGRAGKTYLPYVEGLDGHYKSFAKQEQSTFFDSHFNDNSGDFAFSEIVYEESPANRPLKSFAPGTAWTQNAGNKPIVYDYQSNEIDEVAKWKLEGDAIKKAGAFDAGVLYKQVVFDENGKQVEEFKNIRGHVILKKVQLSETAPTTDDDWLMTYYVYDDLQNLRYVLPPMASDLYLADGQFVPDNTKLVTTEANFGDLDLPDQKLAFLPPATVNIGEGVILEEGAEIYSISAVPDNFIINQNFLDQWAFQYKYDHRQRMIIKQVPGSSEIYMVYDDRDRLVMVQDGNQRAKSTPEWTFTKYDQLNRPILTGIYVDGEYLDQEGMQTKVDDFYLAAAGNTDEFFEVRGAAVHGYSNQSFPKEATSADDYLTVTYFDDYEFSDEAHWTLGDYGSEPSAKSLVTGTKVRVPDLGWNESVTLYDSRYRPASVVSKDYQNNKNTLVNTYFSAVHPLVTKTVLTHESQLTGETVVITRDFNYDHADRLLSVSHKVNDEAAVVILENEYNELGELITKKLHKEAANQYTQEVDYQYNIRGWLTRINDPVSPDPDDFFHMQLKYDEAGQYNGNIGAIDWKNPFETPVNTYEYTYDPVNRLKSAKYNNALTAGYSVSNIDYDANGNILALSRYGDHNNQADQLFDDLDYDYVGNQLTKVTDASGFDTGFKDGANVSKEYIYDANGNMIKDKNKGIESITYNHLNLPIRVEMNDDGSNRIEYIYDAAGTKMAQLVFEDNVEKKRTDYQGAFIYESTDGGSSQLQFIQHEEGRVIPNESEGSYDYQYHLKDHLGNVRATFKTTDDIEASLATFESAAQSNEMQYFTGYDGMTVITADLFNHTEGGNTAIRLDGSTNEREGLGKSLKVKPGDVIDMEVFAKYYDESESGSWVGTLGTIAGQIASGDPTVIGEGSGMGAFSFPFLALMDLGGDNSDGPDAYMNYMVFDEFDNLVAQGYVPVTSAAKEDGNDVTHEHLSASISIDQPGLVYVYLSNENSTPIDVFFDDFKVTQHHTKILSKDDYYPFGLTFSGYSRPAMTAQNFKFNGIERIDDYALGWDVAENRSYDPTISRWLQIDPKTSEREGPYVSFGNNPIFYIDPLGDTTHFFYENGQLAFTINDQLENQIHFISEGFNEDDDVKEIELALLLDPENIDHYTNQLRSKTTAFIGENTLSELQEVWNKGSKEDKGRGLERGGLLQIGENREITIKDLSHLSKSRSSNSMDAEHFQNYSDNNTIGWFHIHLDNTRPDHNAPWKPTVTFRNGNIYSPDLSEQILWKKDAHKGSVTLIKTMKQFSINGEGQRRINKEKVYQDNFIKKK